MKKELAAKKAEFLEEFLDIERQIRNVQSQINSSNNINIRSGANTNIIASNLSGVNGDVNGQLY